ncbi:DUF3632 domain-containing protein [Saccharopolyspora sp. NFXS83]|uniref:DUF3632 domain-containing protein n=1 Tax=Saccharopolyspora sp. NFXS83 TaxID=2993560 RepID=UPI00224B8978|nr:DUF3632 domain-containing protein [Saccharopolyspora sp. NFXS83]MCX2732696.1 DUF3632 domain-containing protein [Saccharopolyspora sp. NFXS83]
MDHRTASRHYRALLDDHLRAPAPRSAARAASLFTEPVRTAFATERAELSTIEGMLWATWRPVVQAARCSRAAQRDLVDLLDEIRDSRALTRDDGDRCVIWGEQVVFTDLPCFGAQLREAWDLDEPGSSEQVNLNAFAARLTAAGIDFSRFAIWTLREHLEDTTAAEDLGAVLPWMRHCGPTPARLCLRPGRQEQDRGPARVGPLGRAGDLGAGGFTPQRWVFWHGRLTELATGHDAVAHQARTALQHMPALESTT